ncbi:Na+/H+ antiporter NhaA [Roseateles terrae]|uniref:Na(+)/H(+) antiporter NhaA n=1 Tax=Roseateles terrae TaxID=431060 RepID=A0ABR6GKK6_9BURK|nr:Na+/H+ antiporter NhaA [Roseateles terrae]MBB3192645.1 NhaA family Na+:H+ antiporter [Roseateles terrae]OWQ90062.1 Na+/H+ antiporter NhaA [Roseateles terrae]
MQTLPRLTSGLQRFFASESSGGIVLAVAALAALLLSNSAWAPLYTAFTQIPGEVNIGDGALVLAKPLIVWVNDLWMAVFFFLVGLEIKREFVSGELAQRSQAVLPAVAALGGMVVPALIYAGLNWQDPVALNGWAIPAATDIAFAIGIVMLLGPRVPASLKIFLTAVAIMDDLGAIVVIALFYTSQLSVTMLAAAAVCMLVLWLLNRTGVRRADLYIVVGLVMWLCVLKSGVHATLAGVATALFIPSQGADGTDGEDGHSPAEQLEHGLHPWVAFLVLPMFAFANAGVSLRGISVSDLLHPVSLGIALGLLLGKAIGVFGTAWLMIRAGWASKPGGADWMQLFGVCVLCGIGFTMSLFIGGLAFAGLAADFETRVKLGVIGGSLLSGVVGTLILMRRPAAAG